jgi:glycogen synthase
MQTGFVYGGVNRPAARQAFLNTIDKALDCYVSDKSKWAEMQMQAMSARFDWASSASQYIELYRQR